MKLNEIELAVRLAAQRSMYLQALDKVVNAKSVALEATLAVRTYVPVFDSDVAGSEEFKTAVITELRRRIAVAEAQLTELGVDHSEACESTENDPAG